MKIRHQLIYVLADILSYISMIVLNFYLLLREWHFLFPLSLAINQHQNLACQLEYQFVVVILRMVVSSFRD